MGIIKPKDFKSTNYDEVVRDQWFSILRIRNSGSFLSPFIKEDRFVIILESKPIRKIVAEDSDKDKIIHLWNILQESVSKLNIHDNDMSDSDKILYITSKIEAMVVKMEVEEKENRTKALLLNLFGVDEPPIISYKCTLKGNPFAGIMYITNYRICYYSQASSSSSLSIRIKDIASIKKEYVFSLMDGLRITEDNGNHYTFTSFDDRDEAYNSICSLWYIYMDHILDHEEFLASEKAILRIERREGIIQDDEVSAYKNKIHRISSSAELKDMNFATELSNIFRFPSDEKLHYIFHCGFLEQKANIYVKGKLYITSNFVSFCSTGKSIVKFTFPFFDIHCIEKSIKETSSVIIYEKNIVAELIGPQSEVFNVFGLLVKLKNSSQEKTINFEPMQYIQDQYSEKIIQLVSMTKKSDPYIENKEKINKELENNNSLLEWSNYFSIYGEGYCIIRTELFDKLIEKGIPNRLRGFLWQYCSGALNNRYIFESNEYYNNLLQKAKSIQEDGDPNGIFEEIEKDLMRSFPEHPYYQTEEGINALRNVLMACSLHNEKIGYCQAMNIVCSILLLYMDEKASFYLMNIICEYLMPRCFTKSMAGSLIDQNIFEHLLRQRLPELYKHLIEENVPIKAVVIPWFLCLFVDCFPLETVLRIFDLFFLNGVQSLYQVALAIFSYNEKRILSLHDGYNITALLKEDNRITPDNLMNEINEKFSDINLENSIFYRRFHAHRRVHSITKSWKNNYIEKIKSSVSNIPSQDIENLYNMYIDVIRVESVFLPPIGEREYFLFMRNFDWYNALSPEEKKKTYNIAKRDEEGKIHLNEILNDLNIWIYSGLEGKLLFCIQLFGYDKDSLSLSQTFDIIHLFAKIEKRPLNHVKEFVKNIFNEMNLKEEESTKMDNIKMFINRICTNE